jgi:adenylosuccinate synthase
MIKFADIIVDLQAGDTGKGKVAHHLANSGEYTHIIRYNGGGNAGHTVYHKGNKIVTHFIPVGVLYGITSIIGPGCVVNIEKLNAEISELENHGINVGDNLKIDFRTHVITKEHQLEDSTDTKIGTTKTGNGPCYRDKYSRTGIRAESFPELSTMLIDTYEELYNKNSNCLLFEGAQGFELDIDWGDYPYVTSSHCTLGGALLNGVAAQKVRKVYGVAKAYRTYVGNKQFEREDPVFDRIRELGQEYGATTGRKRQIDWLNLDDIIKAARINGVTHLVINKLDILTQVEMKLYHNNKLHEFTLEEQFTSYIKDIIVQECEEIKEVVFSITPLGI